MYFLWGTYLVTFTIILAASCSQNYQEINSDNGEIFSPNYPYKYPNNQLYEWNIYSCSGRRLKIHVVYFCLYSTVECNNEYLAIYSEGKLLGKGCGTSLHNKTFESIGKGINVRFQTDNHLQDVKNCKGFHAKYIAIDANNASESSEVGDLNRQFSTVTSAEYSDVRSHTSTDCFSSPSTKTADITHGPQTTVSLMQTISLQRNPISSQRHTMTSETLDEKTSKKQQTNEVNPAPSVKDITVNPPSPVKNTTVSIIIGVSVATVVGMVITIGLIILFIKRKKSNSKTNMPRHLRNLSVEMYSIEPSTIESNKSATMELNVGAGNQDVYTVPMKKNVRKEEIYQDNLTEYDSLNTSRPKINGSGESNVYNMTTAVTDNVYGTNKKDDVIGNEFYDSMGRIAMSEPGGNELYDTATNNGYTSNDVIVPDGSYGIIL